MTTADVDTRVPEPPSAREAPGAGRPRWLEALALVAILLLAALVRLPGLEARGQWDSDQGRDMEVLAGMVEHGQIPLLGPHTLAGTFHHGALYYYLFAPAAALSGSDPGAVTEEFALLSVAAVAATWWLGRALAGPVAGALAGLFAAVSPAGIGEAVFIWNPNPVPLFAAIAFAAALQARRSGRARWWAVSAIGAMGAMQLHVEGGVILVPLAWAWLADLRARRSAGRPVQPLLRSGVAAVLILAAGYVPLAIHELTTGFSEVRALVAWIGGGGTAGASIPERLVMVALRSLTWPIAGLVTDRVAVSLVTLAVVVALTGIALVRPRPAGVTWLIGTIAWSVVALAFLAPTLAVVTPGLPNDHYHAFLDPIVLTLCAAGIVAVATGIRRLAAGRRVAPGTTGALVDTGRFAGFGSAAGPAVAACLVVVIGAISVTAWPPAVSPDGGWPLADAAAARIVDLVRAPGLANEPRVLVSLPIFKPDDAMRFPLEREGLTLEPPIATDPSQGGTIPTGVVVIVCDPLFDEVSGLPCGGPAEDTWLAQAYPPATMQLVDRFRAGDRRVLSIYDPSLLATR